MKSGDIKLDKVLNLWPAIAAVCLIGTVFMVGSYIIGRQWLGTRWMFVEEFSAYLLVLFVYFPLAYTLKTGGHIRVSAVTRALPHKGRMVLDAVTSVMALAAIGYMLKLSIVNWLLPAWTQHTLSWQATHIPMWIPYIIIPLGLVPFGISMMVHIVRRLRSIANESDNEQDAKAG